MAMAAATAGVEVLGDDLLREVLLRLPSPAALVRATLAGRSFLRAARDAGFLRRFRARHHTSPPRLLGFLFVVPGTTPPVLLSAASASGSPPAGDFSLSFLPGGGWACAEWELMDCRDGLLLLLRNHGAAMNLAVADPLRRAYYPFDVPTADIPVGYGLAAAKSASFRVVCIARGRDSTTLRAMVLSSDEPYYWKEVDAITCEEEEEEACVAYAARPMKAKPSLYWKLDDGTRMAAFDAAPGKMKLSILDLPPFPLTLAFDVIDTEDDNDDGLRVLAMRDDFCLETWKLSSSSTAAAAVVDEEEEEEEETPWTLEDTSVRFYRALESMLGERKLSHRHRHRHRRRRRRRYELEIVGVVDGFFFFRQSGVLLSIDLKTMELTRLSEQDCSPAAIYPYTRAWPPSFLNPTD
uniref:F-box domain-containing protein n=1 Tax=Oryza punctata TaxID=4537 RepID=A0A0E0KYG6_ORYPU